MPTPTELVRFLIHPNESLTREYKSWLALTENNGRATLAKAAIALANSGGGIIVLGMRPDNGEGGQLVSQPRPHGLRRYSQDDVNAAVNRFADPAFHCELVFATHPDTNVEHAFVVVPGDMQVPVMSTRECQGVVAAQRCYVRKPGPRSEEPHTADEWRDLIQRCVRAGRESMLDAIRVIVQGGAVTTVTNDAREALVAFTSDALQRWNTLIEPLAVNDPARFRSGRRELSFHILNVAPAPNLAELGRRMEQAAQINHTGWGPFVRLTRRPISPYPFDGLIEAWIGTPEDDRARRDAAHCDFWRVASNGRLFLVRGYTEDALEGVQPGATLDMTSPIWNVGEAMLYVSRLARTFGENPRIFMRCRYTGLHGRILARLGHHQRVYENRQSFDEEITLETEASAAEVDDNLVEILHPLLSPLYESFSFYELQRGTVAQEVEALRRSRF